MSCRDRLHAAFGSCLVSMQQGPSKRTRSTRDLPKGVHLGKAAITLAVKQTGGYVSDVTFTEDC